MALFERQCAISLFTKKTHLIVAPITYIWSQTQSPTPVLTITMASRKSGTHGVRCRQEHMAPSEASHANLAAFNEPSNASISDCRLLR